MNSNKKDANYPELSSNFLQLVSKMRPSFGQERVYQRAVALLLAELFALGRHTVTQLLQTLGALDGDWSSWYRLFSEARFREKLASRLLVQEIGEEMANEPVIVAGADGVQLPRTSRTMPGTHWARALNTAYFAKGLVRAQRYVAIWWLTPLVKGYSRAIPLRCLPAFVKKAVASSYPAAKEWAVGLELLVWLRQQLDELGWQQKWLLLILDGSYDVAGLWAGLPERVWVIARTARNRVLCYLPTPVQGKRKRGRPRQYGRRAKLPREWLKSRRQFQQTTVLVRGKPRPMRYQVRGPFLRHEAPDTPLFLLVIGGRTQKGKTLYQPSYYLVTAVQRQGRWQLPLPIETLLTWLWQRWELEVGHRELKSGFGLGDKQGWHPTGTVVATQWTFWLYALLLLAAYQTWGVCGGPQPPGRWRKPAQRWSFNTLWRAYRIAFWELDDFRACWSPSAPNWQKKEAHLTAMANSLLGSMRA
ncbi:MAG: hypothetical protein KDE04_10075 [Anaerolineales bacterium]|nr:hypothetical protein [Anaerolineales bacterium]